MSRLLGNGNLNTLAEGVELFVGELLFLVGGVARFGGTETVALDRLGENDGRPVFVFNGALVSVENLLRIVTAETKRGEFGVGQMSDQLEQFGILAEKFLADVGAALDLERLPFPVHGFVHALQQQA